jgi:hypothetical protein
MKRKPAKASTSGKRLVDPGAVLAAISKDIRGVTTIEHVERIACVPTIFTGLNRALGTGGWPRKGVSLVHGLNSKGKTVLALGVLLSFARSGEVSLYADMERVTDDIWTKALLRMHEKQIGYCKPADLNDLERTVRKLIDRLAAAKKKQVRADIGFCTAVDTLSKSQPERTMEKIRKVGLKAGRTEKAAQQTMWLHELVPLIDDNNVHMLFVCQERMNQDRKSDFDPKFLPDVPQAFLFDNQVQIRIWGASAIKVGPEGNETIVGFEHRASLAKSKIGIGGRSHEFSFFTSNGMGDCPLGFDDAREIINECRERGGQFYRKVERDDHEYIESIATGEKIAVKGGEREFRRVLRNEEGLVDAYRKVLDAHIPDFYDRWRDRPQALSPGGDAAGVH